MTGTKEESMRLPTPSRELRDQMLRSIRKESRFAPFTPQVAELLDLPEDEAERLLLSMEAAETFSPSGLPNIDFCWVRGGPKTAHAMTGFVRMPALTYFPKHQHLGVEKVLLLQGSCMEDEDGAIFRPGDLCVEAAGSSHAFAVRPGPDLVYLAVVEGGVQIENGPRLVPQEPSR